MRYFEVSTHYYALIKAVNVETAKEKYIAHGAEDDGSLKDEIVEVGRDYALAKFSQAPGEGANRKMIPIKQVLEDFHCAEYDVLIIDRNLI